LDGNAGPSAIEEIEHVGQSGGTSSHGGVVAVSKSNITASKPDELREAESVVLNLMVSHVESGVNAVLGGRFNTDNLSESVVDDGELRQTEVSIAISISFLEKESIQSDFLAVALTDFSQIRGTNSSRSGLEKGGNIRSICDASQKGKSN